MYIALPFKINKTKDILFKYTHLLLLVNSKKKVIESVYAFELCMWCLYWFDLFEKLSLNWIVKCDQIQNRRPKKKKKIMKQNEKKWFFLHVHSFFPSLYISPILNRKPNTHILRKNFNVIVCASSKIPTVVCCFSFSFLFHFCCMLLSSIFCFGEPWLIYYSKNWKKKQRKRGKSKQHTIQNFYSTWMCVCVLF